MIEKTEFSFNEKVLQLYIEEETQRICELLRDGIFNRLHRRGAVIGISGGIDSSVVLALCTQALGSQRVLGVMLPEKDSSPESAELAKSLADRFGVEAITENITDALEGAGCYQRRDDAIRQMFAAFGDGWKSKITLPGSLLDQATLNVFSLTVVDPEGNSYMKRLTPAVFSQIVAASNYKQRMRMSMLYYHAELRGYAVIGTANKNEHDLGFFVKHGDAGVDINPIIHLFKSQVYQLARSLNIPEEIQQRTPTSDTYSAGSSQEEFFFRLPFDTLDAIWAGSERGFPVEEIAAALGLAIDQVARVVQDIARKQRTTDYLRMEPIKIF